jgi:predicted SprT family Zn-dependent metalloprotease
MWGNMLQDRMNEVRIKCQELLNKAEKIVGMPMPSVTIGFNLRGRVAGYASRRGRGIHVQYGMRFNTDMMQNQSWDHIINDTVPHEVAHIVCFVTGRDRGHGRNWMRLCQQLGGTGATRHSEEVVYAKGNTYVYTTTTGARVNVSQTIHRKIQMGSQYIWKRGGEVNRGCAYNLLGQEPVAPTVVPTKEVPFASLLPAAPKVVGGKSKADQYRARVAAAAAAGESDEVVIQFGITVLGMTRQLSRAYLKAIRARG